MKKDILIVTAQYYPEISENLKQGASKYIRDLHLEGVKVVEIDVPGIFEIPVVIAKNVNSYDGFVALGCVIKGKTPHFEIISKATINALMDLSIKFKKPIGNGIITCLNKKQALERSNPQKKNKGREAAEAVLSVLEISNNDYTCYLNKTNYTYLETDIQVIE